MIKCREYRCAAGLEPISLYKVHSVSYRRIFRSIGSYISLNHTGSNRFWWTF